MTLRGVRRGHQAARGSLKTLEDFKEKWSGQLLSRLGTEVCDADGVSQQQCRQTMLWSLFDAMLVAS